MKTVYVIARMKKAEVMYLTRAHRYSPDLTKAMVYQNKAVAEASALHNEEAIEIKQENK
jgi:hypothetical protein